MKLRISVRYIYIVISALLSGFIFVSFSTFSKFFGETSIFYLGIPFAISIFFFSLVVLHRDIEVVCSPLYFKYANLQSLIYIFTILSVINVLFVPVYNGSMLEWMNISLLNWLRYFSAILLTSFLPGYFLLKMLNIKQSVDVSTVIVLSYLLSIFITFFMGFCVLTSTNSFNSLMPVVIGVNLLLCTTYYLTSRKKNRNYLVATSWLELGFILSLLTVITTGSIIVMINNAPLTPGDMQDHYGFALDLSSGFPVYSGKMITYHGGYLFPTYLNILFVLSGIPPALAEQGLYILSFMPFLAFYSLVKAWFGEDVNKKLPLVAAMLSVLLGFGGLFALYLKLTNSDYTNITQLLSETTSKTYDIYMRILYLPDIVAPIWNIGLPVFFMLLCFLGKGYSSIIEAVIISILVALGYMGHTAEALFFIIVIFAYALFFRRRSSVKIGLCIILGLVMVTIVDLTAPVQIFILSGVGSGPSLPFITSLIMSVSISILELVKENYTFPFLMELKKFLLEKLKSWRYGKWIVIYVYCFLFIIWLVVEKDFDLWTWGGYSFTPFFVFPLRFGFVGLLALVTVCTYFRKLIGDKRLSFFLSLIAIGLVLEQLANYYITYYPPYRYGTLTFIGACVIAAYGIVKSIDKIRSIKCKMIVCMFLCPLILFGMLTTALFYVNASYYSLYDKLLRDELDALDYIRQHTPANASVLTFTAKSAKKLSDFAGLNAVQDAQRWSKLLLSTSNPYVMSYVIGLSNVKFIYVSQRDVELLKTNNILNSFVESFSRVFENDFVTVYEVPPLTPPLSQASVGILHFSPLLQGLENTTWIDDSFIEGWHPYRQYGKIKNHESEVQNGIMRVSVTSNQSGNVWASYALSGLSLNTTIYPILFFRYRVDNDLTWFTLQLWNQSNKVFLYIGHQMDKEFATKVVQLPKNQIVTKIEIIVETVKDAPANTTARACIDYVKLSAPVLSWREDTFRRDWVFFGKHGNVNDWNANSDGDILKINVTSNQNGTVWVSYSAPLAIKTKDSVLSFRYKVDNDYTWFTVVLQNTTHRFFFYKGHLTDKMFTMKSFPLPDGQIISRVEIIVETTDKAPAGASATAQIDFIEISPSPFSKDDVFPSLFISFLHSKYSILYVDDVVMQNLDAYISNYTHVVLTSDPPLVVNGFLNWVSEGNTLIILNTCGSGFFANFLKLDNRTSNLLIRELGSGKILYINSIGKESELLQPYFLEKVKAASGLEECKYKVNALPVYNSTFGSTQIKGNLNIYTDLLVFKGSINLTNSSSLLNELIEEITIYGKVNLMIKNANLLIFPSESYMVIKPESYPVEGEVTINDSRALIVSDTNIIYNSNRPVSFRFKTTSLSLHARLPSMSASGTITFDQLDVHAALYIPLAGIVQQKAEIQGEVKFDTMYVSNPLILFSMFKAEGKILNLAETTFRPSIPWFEVLSSPYNIAFNTFFLSGIVVYIFIKKRFSFRIK